MGCDGGLYQRVVSCEPVHSIPCPLLPPSRSVESQTPAACCFSTYLYIPIFQWGCHSASSVYPWRCLCFGLSEQMIYTCPFPFFPPFLRTDCLH